MKSRYWAPQAKKKRMKAALKTALEDLLRSRRLQEAGPPLRGEDRRLLPLPTGVAAVDGLLGGGLPRGQVSEVYGPRSSGRTGLVLSLAAAATARGSLTAWVDPADRLAPASAAAAGVDLGRLLWLRGDERGRRARGLPEAVSAVATLVGSGLFEVVVLDVAAFPSQDLGRLPGATWIRLQRMIADSPAALVIVADAHVSHGPGGASLSLFPAGPRWSGPPGPGRLLRGLGTELQAGRHVARRTAFELTAFV
jgi:RecA DNA recombination protein